VFGFQPGSQGTAVNVVGKEIVAFPSGLKSQFPVELFLFAAICLSVRRRKYWQFNPAMPGRIARTLGKRWHNKHVQSANF
jgi:hypothetical protein